MNDEATPADASGDELDQVRQLILIAHADVVPELLAGATVRELVASIEPARGAYRSVIARMAAPAPPVPPAVPAGASNSMFDPEQLPAHELIKRGLRSLRTRP